MRRYLKYNFLITILLLLASLIIVIACNDTRLDSTDKGSLKRYEERIKSRDEADKMDGGSVHDTVDKDRSG